MPKTSKKLLILIIAVVSLLAWVCFVFFLSGHFSANYRANKVDIFGGRGVLSSFSPSSRVSASNEAAVLDGDPVYFSLFAARPINKLRLKITYKADLSPDNPIIEAGVLMGDKSGGYQLKPVENYWLENKYSSWTKISSAGIRLYERNDDYDSVEDFLADMKAGKLSGVASYNYHVKPANPFYPTSGTSSLPLAIRGTHQMYAVCLVPGLEMSFNAKAKEDAKDRTLIVEAHDMDGVKIGGDSFTGLIEEDGREAKISVNNCNPGSLVKVAIKADRNVVISRLSVNSPILSFINRIDLAGESAVTMFTDRPFVMLQTANPLARGQYTIGDGSILVDNTFQQFSGRSQSVKDKYRIDIPYGDIEVANNGLLSFSNDSLIIGNEEKIDQYFQYDSNLDYIIAGYDSPKIQDSGWKRAEIEFDMHGAYREKNRYQLIFSLPRPFVSSSFPVYIKSVEAEASATSIWEKIKSTIGL